MNRQDDDRTRRLNRRTLVGWAAFPLPILIVAIVQAYRSDDDWLKSHSLLLVPVWGVWVLGVYAVLLENARRARTVHDFASEHGFTRAKESEQIGRLPSARLNAHGTGMGAQAILRLTGHALFWIAALAVMLAEVPRDALAFNFVFWTPLVGLALYGHYKRERRHARRAREVYRFARENGFDFTRAVRAFDSAHVLGFKVFRPDDLSTIKGQRTSHLISKDAGGTSLKVFDHMYNRPGKHSAPISRTVGWLVRRSSNLPDFLLEPAQAGERAKNDMFGPEVALPDFPNFASKYSVRGNDQAAIRAVFHSDLVSFFLERENVHLQCSGNAIVYWYTDKVLPVSDFPAFLEDLKELTVRLATKAAA